MVVHVTKDGVVDTTKCEVRSKVVDTIVKCPVCGYYGKIIVRCRKGRYYAYIYHGYHEKKKVEHYVGIAPRPDSPDFENWLRNLEEKRRITIELTVNEYNKLREIAEQKKQDIAELILEIVRSYIDKMKQEYLEKKLSELESKRTPPHSPVRSPGRPGRSGGERKSWEWWKGGARRS